MLPRSLWNRMNSIKCRMIGAVGREVAGIILPKLDEEDVQRILDQAGYNVARKGDYYSPLPLVASLRKSRARWDRPSALRGIDYDISKMESLLLELVRRYREEFATYPAYEHLQAAGFGPGYTATDALTLYMMIRHIRPRRYVEVGSGLSTYYASLAASMNAAEGYPVEITCIEPFPYEKLYSIQNISIIKSEVQSVDPGVFQGLKENDILFIDSSHILKIDGDVAHLILEILPSLAPKVLIHVHDVPFPYNTPYPADVWTLDRKWPVFWNEAMVLQAFLCYNAAFNIVLSTPLIRHLDESFLKAHIPNYETVEQNCNAFSSIWLRRAI